MEVGDPEDLIDDLHAQLASDGDEIGYSYLTIKRSDIEALISIEDLSGVHGSAVATGAKRTPSSSDPAPKPGSEAGAAPPLPPRMTRQSSYQNSESKSGYAAVAWLRSRLHRYRIGHREGAVPPAAVLSPVEKLARECGTSGALTAAALQSCM